MIAYRQNAGWQLRERPKERNRAIDVELSLPDVLEIAEEIEIKRLHLYLRMAEWSTDSRLHGLCRWFTRWSRKRANTLARRRRCVGGSNSTSPHRHVLAGLAFFAADDGVSDGARAMMTKARLLRNEIDRSRRAVVFYEGLKGFTRDETAKDMIGEMIGDECHHLGEMVSIEADIVRDDVNVKRQ